jgi:hypothetical protein
MCKMLKTVKCNNVHNSIADRPYDNDERMANSTLLAVNPTKYLITSPFPSSLYAPGGARIFCFLIIPCFHIPLAGTPAGNLRAPPQSYASTFRSSSRIIVTVTVLFTYRSTKCRIGLYLLNRPSKKTKTPWPESVSDLYRPSDHRMSAKLVRKFADIGCHLVSVADFYGRILGFLDRSSYFFFQVAPQLYSLGSEDPVPDPLLLRESGSAGNLNPDLWICGQELVPHHRICF